MQDFSRNTLNKILIIYFFIYLLTIFTTIIIILIYKIFSKTIEWKNLFLMFVMMVLGIGLAINPVTNKINSNLLKATAWLFVEIFQFILKIYK